MLSRSLHVIVFCSVTLISGCRHPHSEDTFFGTWQLVMPRGMDSTDWITFRRDHSFVWFNFSVAGDKIDMSGTWSVDRDVLHIRSGKKQQNLAHPFGTWLSAAIEV